MLNFSKELFISVARLCESLDSLVSNDSCIRFTNEGEDVYASVSIGGEGCVHFGTDNYNEIRSNCEICDAESLSIYGVQVYLGDCDDECSMRKRLMLKDGELVRDIEGGSSYILLTSIEEINGMAERWENA